MKKLFLTASVLRQKLRQDKIKLFMELIEKIKSLLKNDGFQIALLVIGVLAFTGWYKSGGDFEGAVGFIIAIVFFLIVLFIAGFAAMFVRNYLDEKQTKIKNSNAKFFLTRLTLVGVAALIFFIFIKVF